MVSEVVNWEDPALQPWLGTITRPRTKYNYRTAFRSYASFTGLTASALVDEEAFARYLIEENKFYFWKPKIYV